MSYAIEYQASIDSPTIFWGNKAKQVPWFKAPQKILTTDENGMHRWFADGVMNTCYMSLDYHVAQGRGEQVALIYDSPITATKKQFTYTELLEKVARFAGLLQANGLTKGDRVVIYMPMISEAVIAMLATARIGAVHSVVFGGFSAHELAVRIDDAQPKLLITASCGIEVDRIIEYKPMIDEAIELAVYKPAQVILLQREQCLASMQEGRDINWADTVKTSQIADCVSVSGTDPLYILYTSGKQVSLKALFVIMVGMLLL